MAGGSDEDSAVARSASRTGGGGAGAGGGGGGGGGKRVGRPPGSGVGAKKKRIISPKYGVLDRVLLGLYDDDANIVGYLLGTVQSIYTTVDGCLYTLLLDRDNEEKKDVDEEALFRSVDAV